MSAAKDKSSREQLEDEEETRPKDTSILLMPTCRTSDSHYQNNSAFVGCYPLAVTIFLLFMSILVPELVFKGNEETTIFLDQTSEVHYILVHAAIGALGAYIFLHWVFFHISKTSKFLVFEAEVPRTSIMEFLKPNVSDCILVLLIFLQSAKEVVRALVKEQFQEYIHELVNFIMGCTILTGWIYLLEQGHNNAHQYADKVEGVLRANKKTSKWTTILTYFSSFQDKETDDVYGIPGGVHSNQPKSPARVLADVIGIYVLIGEIMGYILLLLFFVGVDLYQNIVVFGLTVLFTAVVTALHLGAAVGSIIPLVLSNCFHVGEIVSFTNPGSEPGDNPKKRLTGFVEGITLGHCVIRDFRRKQVHIPISDFRKLVVSNWTRRPTKSCHFLIHVELGLVDAAVPLAQLSAFLKRWIAAHPGIDHNSYVKSAAKISYSGQCLEVVFYPLLKFDVYQLRAEFLVAVTGAAKRLGVCILPVEVRVPFGSKAHGGDLGADVFGQNGTDDGGEQADPLSPRYGTEKQGVSSRGGLDEERKTTQQLDEFDVLEDMLNDLMPSEAITSKAGYKSKDE